MHPPPYRQEITVNLETAEKAIELPELGIDEGISDGVSVS